jgi:hypothetical protein
MRKLSHWVMDYETMTNCFIAVFHDYKGDEVHEFVLHEKRYELEALLTFLKENKKHNEIHISFNGLGFDAQITEFILRNPGNLLNATPKDAITMIYNKAQDVINRQNKGEWQEYPEWQLSIQQVDVFKLNHWDNPAKRSSLKWIQFSMDWENLQEMPIHHTTPIFTLDEVYMVLDYCHNDVKSTKQIMELSKEQIKLRKSLTDEYRVNLFSASEPRISKELFLLFLSQQIGVHKRDLKDYRTNRTFINLGEIIVPYIAFNTKMFQDLHSTFKNVIINAQDTKGGFKHHIIYKGVKTDFGLGGVHGCRKAGIYEETEDTIIMTSDVISFYPNLAIRNKWAPAHLPKEEFCKLYEWFFEERKKIPKKDPKNYVYKIILNSTYGLSNDTNSFLYDPEFTMRITINGQLSLMMLYEMLAEGIPDSVPLMQNTDGLEMMIPKQYKQRYLDICAEWEKITNLQLEHDQYKKMIIGDVNNYIAVPVQGKPKCKGRFEWEDLALHKNKSHLIIPKAIYHYFVNDILPEDYLKENRNIFDYCAGVKIKGNWEFVGVDTLSGKYIEQPLQNTIRYYISNRGCKIVKRNKTDLREIQVESGKWMQTVFNTYQEKSWEEYGVNENYYLDKIYKEISNIKPPIIQQLTLF